jgi:diguanylate cyclase (GGDEF)-like protein
MLSAMTAFLLIFIKLGNNVPDHGVGIRYAGIFFISFILAWCAGVSLLDQLTNGQVIVYVVAIISIAVTPIYEPFLLLLMYLIIHIFFLILMPYFQKSAELLFANSVNSTAFLIMSWAISCMRYKKHAEDFNNKKIIQEKNDELKWMNKELEEANRKLEILSQTDALTGVFNRFMFETKMKEEWCRCKRHSIPLSLIMADIDHFKSFNDKYGHQAGDHCIQQIAGILSASARRSSDIVARYGGEEFAIVLPHIEKEKALELAEQMRKRAEEMAVQHLHSDISDNITISMGVNTVIPTDELSIEGFINNTDNALYKAKESRNCVCSV